MCTDTHTHTHTHTHIQFLYITLQPQGKNHLLTLLSPSEDHSFQTIILLPQSLNLKMLIMRCFKSCMKTNYSLCLP